MRVLRILGVALVFAAVAACSQPAPSTSEPAAASEENVSRAVLDALTPTISNEIGIPIELQLTTSNVNGDWAYIVAQPTNPEGTAIDWSTTQLASRYENGVMDEGGAVHALLQQQDGVWTVVEHVIAPTDVAWIDWAALHNVPAGVVEAPAAP